MATRLRVEHCVEDGVKKISVGVQPKKLIEKLIAVLKLMEECGIDQAQEAREALEKLLASLK